MIESTIIEYLIESTIIEYLSGKLSVPVYGGMPSYPPASFVTVEKTGSRRVNRLDAATLVVESWAASIEQAAQLNKQVKAAMFDSVELDSISSCDLDTDYNYTDSVRKRPRYQAVFDLVYYN